MTDSQAETVTQCGDLAARPAACFTFDLSPRTVLRRLMIAVSVLIVASFSGQVLLREAPQLPLPAGIASRLYVDSEQSLPTIFSVFLIGAAVVLLIAIAALHRRAGSRDVRYWALAAALAAALAVDEYLSLHEQLIEPVRAILGGAANGPLHYAWVVPGIVLVIVTTALFIPFLRRLPTRLRTLVLVSGGVYLSGALGMEMVGGALDSARGDRLGYQYLMVVSVEEALEMVGVVLLCYALLDYLSKTFDVLNVRGRLS